MSAAIPGVALANFPLQIYALSAYNTVMMLPRDERYRAIICDVLREYASIRHSGRDTCYNTVFDRQSDRYLIISIGWDGTHRVHDLVIQLDLIKGKIWIQCDNTDAVVAHDLERAGVPKHDIVLGFRPPEVRPLTDYAVA